MTTPKKLREKLLVEPIGVDKVINSDDYQLSPLLLVGRINLLIKAHNALVGLLMEKGLEKKDE